MKRKVSMIVKVFGVIFFSLFLFMLYVEKSDKECIAYYIDNYQFDPIVFEDEIYFPNTAYSYGENGDISDHARKYGKIANARLYEKKGEFKTLGEYMGYFLMNNVWVYKNDNNYEHLLIRGGYGNEYSKVSYLEEQVRIQELLENYSSFILVSKNYTFDKKCLIPKDLIIELEMQYGKCDYALEDFNEMAEAYYIYVNPFFQSDGSNEKLQIEAEENRHISGDYIATIFVDENANLYYCNRNNPINDEMTQKIKNVLIEGNMIEE